MSCTSPVKCWLPKVSDSFGKKHLRFKPPTPLNWNNYLPINTNCGHCLACDKSRAINTAIQLYCELRITKKSSFFTTHTYDDDNLPLDGSVSYRHMKNTIQSIRRKYDKDTRYYSQNEYGGNSKRAHTHFALFGLEINDLKIYDSDNSLKSESMDKIWKYGTTNIQRLEFGNCLYISSHHYQEKSNQNTKSHLIPYIHPVTFEIIKERKPEFSTRSLGIGREFYNLYFNDLFNNDSIIVNQQKFPVPKYFMNKLKSDDPELYEELKQLRLEKIETKTHAQNKYQEKFNQASLKTSLGQKL